MAFDENPRSGKGKFTPVQHSEPEIVLRARGDLHADLEEVLESAAKLQQLVPDAVLVGGSAAALYAAHRASYDHDHVLTGLRENFDLVLGGIETGLRQLIRRRPLEVVETQLPSGAMIRVPTRDEALRIKAFLITRRNQTRDYLDVAALADTMSIDRAAEVLRAMDDYYADQNQDGTAVSSQVVRQLADPKPKDSRTTTQLGSYKGLAAKWQDWSVTVETCQEIATEMVLGKEEP